jgi:uncharacterized damage-inducible protein DinB
MEKSYRDNGAIGALLDEYERAVKELKSTISKLSTSELIEIVDFKTKDGDCKSIQTILSHVVRAGYCYVIEIRKSLGEDQRLVPRRKFESIDEYVQELDLMFAFNEKLFEDYPDIHLEENNNAKKILVAWGQSYDIEQLIEHAIVHVLRHRRQIERFILKLNDGMDK